MKFELPFKDAILDELVGKTLIMAENHRNSVFFKPVKELYVGGCGDCQKGWRLQVVDGVLRIIRDNMAFCDFDGLECRRGTVYAVGRRLDMESRSGFDRMVLYEKKTLDLKTCKICVSSHVDYENTTIPILAASLKKAKFDLNRVQVVVGGDPRNDGKEELKDGIKIIRTGLKAMGFVGLSNAGQEDGVDYWMLVHDTCDFERDFTEKLASVEVGLEPDVVLIFPPDQKNEMGFYSSKFLRSTCLDVSEVKPDMLFDWMMMKAAIVMVKEGKNEVLGEKDVYGGGMPRKTVRVVSMGLRKHFGSVSRGGRP